MEIFGVIAIISFAIKIIHDIVVSFRSPKDSGEDDGFFYEDTMNKMDK